MFLVCIKLSAFAVKKTSISVKY